MTGNFEVNPAPSGAKTTQPSPGWVSVDPAVEVGPAEVVAVDEFCVDDGDEADDGAAEAVASPVGVALSVRLT